MTASLKIGPLTSDVPDAAVVWDELLAVSDSDPLFNSRSWQELWWSIWGRPAGFELTPVSIGQAGGPRALAPLYVERRSLKGIPVRRLQFMGANEQTLSTPRCEYRDILAAGVDRPAADRALLDTIARLQWDDFILRDVATNSPLIAALHQWSRDHGFRLRTIYRDRAYAQTCDGTFADYLAGLKPEVRRKLYNKRKQLSQLGTLALENSYPHAVDSFFDILNGFHRTRWGAELYGTAGLGFQKELLGRLAEQGAEPWLSVMRLNGEPISVSYNILFQGRVYNIQSGFNEEVQKSLSLGLIHIGYLLEAAFAHPDVKVVDFLAGYGKKSNYKADICNEIVEMHSFQVVRSPLLKLLYWLNDLQKRRRPR